MAADQRLRDVGTRAAKEFPRGHMIACAGCRLARSGAATCPTAWSPGVLVWTVADATHEHEGGESTKRRQLGGKASLTVERSLCVRHTIRPTGQSRFITRAGAEHHDEARFLASRRPSGAAAPSFPVAAGHLRVVSHWEKQGVSVGSMGLCASHSAATAVSHPIATRHPGGPSG